MPQSSNADLCGLPGSRRRLNMPAHCDPTVNLYDGLHCVRGDALVEIWPVDARGR